METLRKLSICLTCLLFAGICNASEFLLKNYSVANVSAGRSVDRPLSHATFRFGFGIELMPEVCAYVEHEGKTVAQAVSYESSNFDYKGNTEGTLHMIFSDECLPLGEQYELHLAAGSIRRPDVPEDVNDEIIIPFDVPSDLGDSYSRNKYTDGCVISDCRRMSFSWRFETSPVGTPEWCLYREGDLVRKCPAYIGWDWNIGTASIDFGKQVYFEKGVNYRIVLPAGSVSGHRPDLINKELSFCFVGGYDVSVATPSYYSCSLAEELPDVVSNVNFYYDTAVGVVPGKPIIFSEASQTVNRRWEALPEVSDDGKTWIVSADFGGISLESGKVYNVIMPEGTVVTAEGDILVNRTQTTYIDYASVKDADVDDCVVSITGRIIRISGIATGNTVTVYDASGNIVKSVPASPATVDVEVNCSGVYIVAVGDRILKIAVV